MKKIAATVCALAMLLTAVCAGTVSAEDYAYIDLYKAQLDQHPASIRHETYYGNVYYSYTEYAVYDIDKDGVEELIVKEDTSHYYIYTVKNGACKRVAEQYWSYSYCLYKTEENGLIVHDGGMGSMHYEQVYRFQLNGTAMTEETLLEVLVASGSDGYAQIQAKLAQYENIDEWARITDHSLLDALKPATPTLGDLNGDEELDMRDAFALYSAASGDAELTEEQLAAADMNGDGEYDMRDAYILYSTVSGG